MRVELNGSVDPARLAHAVERLNRRELPDAGALEEVVRVVQALPGVESALRRLRGLEAFDSLWASGEYETRSAVEERVAMRFGVKPATVRWWRWLRELEEEPDAQHPLCQNEPGKEP